MKRIIMGAALVGLAFGCKSSDKNTSVSDPAAANMPKTECCAGKDASKCTEGEKASCSAEKKACCTKTAQTPPNN